MIKLLIATSNPGKLEEIRLFLSDLPLELVSLKDAGITAVPEESGKTFEENAALKARFFCRLSGLPAIADDGGAEIDALNGEPGVKTHRWIHPDRDSTDEELIAYTMEKLKGIPTGKRGMQLRTVVALALPNGKVFTQTAKIRGVVALSPSPDRQAGFPFRSLMYLPQLRKFYNHDNLTPGENARYNHRGEAITALKPVIIRGLTLQSQ